MAHKHARIDKAVKFLRTNGLAGLLAAMRKAGLRGTSQFIVRNIRFTIYLLLSRNWDRSHHVETGGQIELADLNVVGANRLLGNPAVSTSPKTFTFLTRYFPTGREEFTYIDVGSGKGRTLILASEVGFKRTIGVEFSGDVHVLAGRNIKSYCRFNRTDCEFILINEDATQYELPPHKLVLFFANPFLPALWPDMIDNIVRSYNAQCRKMYLILAGSQPTNIQEAASIIAACEIFKPVGRGRAPYYLDTYLPFHYEVFETE